MNAVPIGYEDEEALLAQDRQVIIITNKESLARKAFLVVMMLALVVVCSSIRMRATSLHTTPSVVSSSSNLFGGERSLQGLFGICDRDNRFVRFDWDTTVTGVTIGTSTKKYKVLVPRRQEPYVKATIKSGAGIDIFMSFYKEMPAATDTDTDTTCHDAEGIECELGGQYQDATAYIWIVGDAGGTAVVDLHVGPEPERR